MTSAFARIDWSQPWLAPIAGRGERWRSAALESYERYLGVLNADAFAQRRMTGRGRVLSFVAQDSLPAGASYEGHIAATGCVPTRHNLHDFFNASMWFRFPRVKAALNARQADEIDQHGIGATRGPTRDALTLFDENAVIFACADPSRADALRAFDWTRVFIDDRAAWGTRCDAWIFGHALLEKLVAPYKACTGHAWIVHVAPDFFALDEAQRCAMLDDAVAARLEHDALTSRCFTPLPVLGVPGWWPGNESPVFYDDLQVFRKQRQPGREKR